MIKAISPFFLFIILISPNLYSQEKYEDELVKIAISRKLHESRYWHVLVHYKKSAGGYKSLVDDPKFFNSPYGKKNPQAELEATIRSFFIKYDDESKSTVCRFIARFNWLKKELGIDESKIPSSACRRFENIISSIRPESAALIFPSSNIKSPASMFGHTLIIVETENKNRLLAHALNYSAITPESPGLLFAFRGLFGFYKGYFSVLPYYMKIQEYSDMEYRDIWEYKLNLTRDEVILMLMHLVELEGIYSDYYFIDENCSYSLLLLLEAARPDLNLSSDTRLWVIPSDTIKTARKFNLINNGLYRPSRTNKIKHYSKNLSDEFQNLAIDISLGTKKPDTILLMNIPQETKLDTVDLSIEYLKFIYAKQKIAQNDYQKKFIEITKIRSSMGESANSEDKIAPPVDPANGHKSAMFSISAGIRGMRIYEQISLRPAYHSLIDPQPGFLPGSEIIFGNIEMRYYTGSATPVLERVDILDIFSIAPIDKFFRSFSWKVKTGLESRDTDKKFNILSGYANGGAGGAINITKSIPLYIMADGDIAAGDFDKSKYMLGAGGSAGLLKSVKMWRFHIFIRDIYYLLGERHNYLETVLMQQFSVFEDMTVSANVKRTIKYSRWQNEFSIALNIFF